MATNEQLLRHARNLGTWCNNITSAVHTKLGDMDRAERNGLSDATKAEILGAHEATIQYLEDNIPTLQDAIDQLAAEAQAEADEQAAHEQALSQVP